MPDNSTALGGEQCLQLEICRAMKHSGLWRPLCGALLPSACPPPAAPCRREQCKPAYLSPQLLAPHQRPANWEGGDRWGGDKATPALPPLVCLLGSAQHLSVHPKAVQSAACAHPAGGTSPCTPGWWHQGGWELLRLPLRLCPWLARALSMWGQQQCTTLQSTETTFRLSLLPQSHP